MRYITLALAITACSQSQPPGDTGTDTQTVDVMDVQSIDAIDITDTQSADIQGEASLSCDATITSVVCNGVCTDQSTDNNNCGACGRRCSAPETCIAGACFNCPGQCPTCMQCSPTFCADLSQDENHCGSCNNVCDGGQCVNGQCQ